MTVTALITPFRGKEVDLEGLALLIQRQIAARVGGILLLGTTGEAATLTQEERSAIIRRAVQEGKGQIPIWVGTGRNSTQETIEETRKAHEMGAHIALVVAPYYNKPSQEGLYRHFEAVARSSLLPIILYNVPSRTGVHLEPATVLRLAILERVIGIKEASGHVLAANDLLASAPDPFSVWSGDDVLTLPMMALGAKGVISVVSNLVPEKIVQLVSAIEDNRWSEARALHYSLLPLFKAAFIDVNPVPIKEAMALSGLPAGGVRLPLCEMSAAHRSILSSALCQVGVLP